MKQETRLTKKREFLVDKEAGVSGPRSHVIHVLKQDDWQMELKKIDAAQKEYERKMAKPQT